jgi:very-short-patch-repair endonuclease
MTKHWDEMSEEERDKKVQEGKDRWENMDSTLKEKMNTLRIEALRKAGKEGSKLEKFMLRKLTENGYKVDFHNHNLIPNEKLEIDMYIPKLRTIIEVDGPSHFLPIWGEEKLDKQIKADLKKNGRILSKGFAIIRVKVIRKVSLKRKQDMLKNVLNQLQNIEKKFPPKSQRFIEVEL